MRPCALAILCIRLMPLAAEAVEGVGPEVTPDAWWRQMFSVAFDGHGNFVVPHLGALNATAASMGAMGFHGPWDADLNRDAPWMRGHLEQFEKRPGVKRLLYIEGCGSSKVLCRASADGRILLTATAMALLNDPARRDYAVRQIGPGGVTGWFGDWQFMRPHALKTALGNPLPWAGELGLPPFVHPLDGREITSEEEFWRTRSARPLIGDRADDADEYMALGDADARALGLAGVTVQRDGKWLVKSGATMLYDGPFARYQAAKAGRGMRVFAPDMIHFDDWDLRSPTAMNARADIHVAAFRGFVRRRLSEEECRALGFERGRVTEFDVLDYLLNPPWRGEYGGKGDGPLWRCATDARWLSDKVWRAFQIACIEDRLASMREVYRAFKQGAREVMGRDVPMVANIIPTLGAIFLQRGCVDMSNFEWPTFKTYGSYPTPLGYYPEARLGIGPRMASKIGATGNAIVDPYVEVGHSGWDGKGFTRRHGENLHKVIYFDLVANRGIPAFALTWDGGYSPGSIHSAGQLHAFMNEVAPIISRRDFLADIGLAASSWSGIAAQTPFGGWKHEVAKRHLAEFLGWAQFLSASRDFPQWDVVPFDDATADNLSRFKLVILPSVLAVADAQIAALQAYLEQGGRLIVTGETGAFMGPEGLLLPRARPALLDLSARFPDRFAVIPDKPGLDYHIDRTQGDRLRALLRANAPGRCTVTATGAPEHIGISASESKDRRGELTIDLVNYNHDLASDRITPVDARDFQVRLWGPGLAAQGPPAIESIRYDESAPNNIAREGLEPEAPDAGDGTLAVRVPAFTHYQVIRITRRR